MSDSNEKNDTHHMKPKKNQIHVNTSTRIRETTMNGVRERFGPSGRAPEPRHIHGQESEHDRNEGIDSERDGLVERTEECGSH